jgi:hypothetical protein
VVNIFTLGKLPKLGDRQLKNSISSVNNAMPPVTPEVKQFKVTALPPSNINGSIISLRATDGILSVWSNEESIKLFVSEVIHDVLRALDLSSKVEVHNELSITGLKPDVWLVKIGGAPIGVIEVKCPGVDVLSNPKVLGQIAMYVQMLKHSFGVKYPLGIVTTYTDWRAVWLPSDDAENYFCKRSIESIASVEFPTPLNDLTCSFPLPDWDAYSTPPKKAKSNPKPQKKKKENAACSASSADFGTFNKPDEVPLLSFHASEVFNIDSVDLIPFIGNCILKMYHSPNVVTGLENRTHFIKFLVDGPVWSNFHFSWDICQYQLPPTDCPFFYLVADLRGGLDGRVWLALSSNNCLSVLKIPVLSNGLQVC